MTRRRNGSAAADMAAVRAALGTSVRARSAAAAGDAPVSDTPAFARWENEGGPADTVASQEANDRAVAASERTAWATDAAELGDVGVAVRAYARGRRRDGAELAPTLAEVRAVVAECLTSRLSHDGLAAVQRDVARACLQAYFGS